jgi:DnaJ-domain-containing protein 1
MKPKLADLLAPSEPGPDLYVAFALLWIAAAPDNVSAKGALDTDTRTCLERHLKTLAGGLENADALLAIIADNDLDSFLLVCRKLHQAFGEEKKDSFLKMAIDVAAARQPLAIATNHILRLYTDLLGFSVDHLYALYREKTVGELPEPGDPSSMPWWEAQGQASSHQRPFERHSFQEDCYRYGTDPVAGKRFSRAEAYAVLGLDREAPEAEIKKAYRRLVQHYHPDRYESRGSVAREVAELNFLRVQQAYEVLHR